MHDSLDRKSQTQACINRLRELPSEMQPPYNWQEFQRRSQQRQLSAAGDRWRWWHLPPARDWFNGWHLPATRDWLRRWSLWPAGNRLDWQHLAAAAALLAVVCGIAVWGRVGGGRSNVAPGSELFVKTTADSHAVPEFPSGDIDALRGTQFVRRAQDSRAIETWLATLPREPVVVRVGTRAAVARLEDHIAEVDDLLTSERLDGVRPDRLAALQRERARLVGSLAQVRYAEVVASELP